MAENSEKTAKKPRGSGKQFPKGHSGNPGGRPPKTDEQRTLEAMCRDKSTEALEVLLRIMAEGENERNRITAALAIIERGHGKAVQPTTLSGSLSVTSAKELTDDQLAAIAAGSGAGASGASEG